MLPKQGKIHIKSEKDFIKFKKIVKDSVNHPIMRYSYYFRRIDTITGSNNANVFENTRFQEYTLEDLQGNYTIYTLDCIFEMNKHLAKSVRQVLQEDPGYIIWLDENHKTKTIAPWIVKKAKENIHKQKPIIPDQCEISINDLKVGMKVLMKDTFAKTITYVGACDAYRNQVLTIDYISTRNDTFKPKEKKGDSIWNLSVENIHSIINTSDQGININDLKSGMIVKLNNFTPDDQKGIDEKTYRKYYNKVVTIKSVNINYDWSYFELKGSNYNWPVTFIHSIIQSSKQQNDENSINDLPSTTQSESGRDQRSQDYVGSKRKPKYAPSGNSQDRNQYYAKRRKPCYA